MFIKRTETVSFQIPEEFELAQEFDAAKQGEWTTSMTTQLMTFYKTEYWTLSIQKDKQHA